MTETNNTNDKPGGPPKATLHLKRPVEQGTVRQSFSHGRTKAVVVEKVKRRVPGPGETATVRETITLKPAAAPAAPVQALAPAPTAPAAPAVAPPKTGVVLRTLTGDEIEARQRVLVEAKAREEEDRKRQETRRRLSARAGNARPHRTGSRRSP